MPVYVTLGKYTAEAMKNIHEVPERLQQNTRLIEAKGGKLLALYGLMGNGTCWSSRSSPRRRAP